MIHRLPIRIVIGVVVLLCLASGVVAGDLIYSYRAGEVGGLARVTVDGETGEITRHERLIESAGLARSHKIAFDPDRNVVVLVNEDEAAPAAWIVSLDAGVKPIEIAVPAMPDAVCILDGAAHLGLDDGSIVAIDLDTGSIVAVFDSRRSMNPPGQKPESLCAVPSMGVLLASFQKDHKSGNREGNRIAVLRARSLELVADVRLPRAMAELHNPESAKERGPGPEVIAVCEETGSVLITIDLYGAVLTPSLRDLLKGSIGGVGYLSTGVDGGFGDSFPDRVARLGRGSRARAVVVNSGRDGGGVLVDFGSGEVLHRFEAAHGLELSDPIRDGRIFGAHAGKLKVRARPEVEKSYHPQALLTELIIEGDSVTARRHTAPAVTHLAAPVDPHGAWLLVVMGDGRDRLGRFDTDERAFDADPVDAFGAVERLLTLP